MRQSLITFPIARLGLRASLAASTIAACTLAAATTYYVSPVGSDAANGSLTTPFQTVQRAANLVSPGDTVILRQGVYRETVKPARSGTGTAAIVFKSYPGETATISGADVLTGWTQSGADWQASDPIDLGGGLNQLFVDGQMVTDARWPNAPSGVSRPVFSHIASVSVSPNGGGSKIVVTDPALTQPSGFWIGAHLHFLSAPTSYLAQTGTVTASAPGTITFTTTKLIYIPVSGAGYYIIGGQAQDVANEWYRNGATASLRAPFADAASNHTIEAKKRKYGFDLSGLTNVDLQGLNFFSTAIKSDSATNSCDLSSIRAQYVSHNIFLFDTWNDGGEGIELFGSNNTFTDSVIEFSSGNGITVNGSNNLVNNCLIHDVDYACGDEGAIYMNGTLHQAKHNTVYNFARSGILHYNTTKAKIYNNEIYYGALQSNDCGGTYCWSTDGQGTEIGYNIIHEMSSAPNYANGIFLDDNSSNFVIHHNLTYNIDYGFHQNPYGVNSQVFNNTFSATKASIYFDNRGLLFLNVLLKNNIVDADIWMPPLGVLALNNLMKTTDPKFVDIASANYQLLPGSPAIDAGLILHPFTDNMVGAGPDQGAFENGVAPWSAGAGASIAPPPPPTALATTAGLKRVSLSWLGRPEATAYNIYRSTVAGGPYTIALSGVSGNSVFDTTVNPGTTYYYVMTSVNRNGESSIGAEANGYAYGDIVLHGLVGTYYSGVNMNDNKNGILFDTPLMQRLDANVDFDWGYGSPDPSVPADRFSVIWNGYVTAPVDGTYTIALKTDNGVMLMIDDQVVINQLTTTMGTFYNSVTLKAGQRYRIRLQYFEFDTTAHCSLMWSYPGQALAAIPTSALTPAEGNGVEGNYYNDTGNTFGTFQTYVGTRNDSQINFWANGALYPGQNPTYYSVKWRGMVLAPVDGQYTLDVATDDGQRLIVDGQTLIDSMSQGGRQEKTVNVNWTAGSMHTVEVQMGNGISWGGASLSWSFPGQSMQVIPTKYLYGPLTSSVSGLTGTYFDDFGGGAPSFVYDQATRVDNNVDFDWTGVSPVPNIPSTYYSVRWDGKIKANVTAQHQFAIKYDGGVRLWINNKLVLDSLSIKVGAFTYSSPLTMYAGQKYDIRVEYIHEGGSAKIQLLWQNDSPNGALTVVPKSVLTKTSDLGG